MRNPDIFRVSHSKNGFLRDKDFRTSPAFDQTAMDVGETPGIKT